MAQPHSGELALWRAVIEQALRDVNMRTSSNTPLIEVQRATTWFERRGDDFKKVCEYAGVHPDDVYAEYTRRKRRGIRFGIYAKNKYRRVTDENHYEIGA